jgi:hypothetical protein
LERHRIIIGWLFVSVTMLLAVIVAFTWKKAFGTDADLQAQETIKSAVSVAVLFCGVGLTLILNYRYSAWVCLPLSVASLIYFPLGTALGGYYIWYFWRFIYMREDKQK